ncbi:alpha/beta hydrolase [Companilactobacillus farciminis]|nr:alpha/beta hydrolase [Companilactobacillus farciminis]
MKKWSKNVTFFGKIILFLLGFTVYSSVKNERSISSTVVEKILWFMKDSKTIKQANIDLEKEKKSGEKKYQLSSKQHFDVPIKKINFKGMDTYVLNAQKNNGTTILYIHGGGYVSQPVSQHWTALNKIAKNTDSKIIVPIYPLAPFATYKKSYSLLTEMYQSIESSNNTRKVVLMGDSAGGGIALGLAETFSKLNIAQPDNLILLSPWVDITMENPAVKKYAKKDPMLDTNTLIADGKSWAGSTDTKDYRLSPVYGDISQLKNVTIFVGTREQFYPDIMKLNRKLKRAGVSTNLNVGLGQNHVYPVYPVKEGHEAIDVIINIVDNL